MTIVGSQPSAHSVGINCDRRAGARIRITQSVHGKDPEKRSFTFPSFLTRYKLPEGVGVGGKVGKDVGVAGGVPAGGPGLLLRVLLLQLVVLDRAATVLLRRLPEQSCCTVLNGNLHRSLRSCWPGNNWL